MWSLRAVQDHSITVVESIECQYEDAEFGEERFELLTFVVPEAIRAIN